MVYDEYKAIIVRAKSLKEEINKLSIEGLISDEQKEGLINDLTNEVVAMVKRFITCCLTSPVLGIDNKD